MKMKPTPERSGFAVEGGWDARDNDIYQVSCNEGRHYICDLFSRSEQSKADADLIAEAFNVHHETGLSPRELLEQRDGLLRALEVLVERIQYYSAIPEDQRPCIEQWEYTEGSSDMSKALAAIAATRPQMEGEE